ncbi:MAG: GNAT family N-acetyltransferase [Dokdonella sp.]
MTADPLPRVGQRIILRRLARSDLDAFQSYRLDARVSRFQGWIAQSDDEAADLIERMSAAPLFMASAWVQIGIAERADNMLIGDIGICVHADVRSAEIGFSLRMPSQGRGLAIEAVRETCEMLFQHTAVQAIIAHADARNLASIRLLERLGMRHVESSVNVSHGEERRELGFRLARRQASMVPGRCTTAADSSFTGRTG